MAAELTLTLDRRNLARLRRLHGASRTMAAKALTFTAQKAVPAWKAGHSVFHKRNSWIDRGVRSRPANASTMNAQVGALDKYMGRHVRGVDDEKRGRLFVPLYQRIGEAKTHTRERRKLERMGGTKRKPFRIRTSGGTFLARRKGKKQLPLIILGKFQTGADVTATLDAEAIVNRVARVEFPRIYERLVLKWAESGR
jgi:hypothetical protein